MIKVADAIDVQVGFDVAMAVAVAVIVALTVAMTVALYCFLKTQLCLIVR